MAGLADILRLAIQAVEKDPSMIKAPWILMIETDYVWHKPVQAPRADSDALPIGFPFGYIQPQNPGEARCLSIGHLVNPALERV